MIIVSRIIVMIDMIGLDLIDRRILWGISIWIVLVRV